MFIHCPKCNDLIGDGLDACPQCGRVFTAEDKSAMKEEKREETRQAVYAERDLLETFWRKRRISVRAILACFLLWVVITTVVGVVTKNIVLFIVLSCVFAVAMIGTVIWGIARGGLRCPYCDYILFRNYGDHCQKCGKKIQ